jgi:ribonuclease T1
MIHASKRAMLLAAGIVVAALLLALAIGKCSAPSSTVPRAATPAASPSGSGRPTPVSGLPTVVVAGLPPEAIAMLGLIDRGGPFRFAQDDTIFSNIEGLLPARAKGYYREYTVVTPGAGNRGTRRLIAGREGDIYYTDDHYKSFRQVIR